MPSPSQSAVEQALAASATLLKSVGFKRKGRTFVRHGEGFANVVHVQSSQWNTAGRTRFTLNLGVYEQEVAVLIGRTRTVPPERVDECTYVERVGCLVPKKGDLWWEIDQNHPAVEVGEWVHGVVSEYVLPWFYASKSRTGFVRMLRARGGWGVVDLLWQLNERKLALEALENVDDRTPYREESLREWKLQHGIDA